PLLPHLSSRAPLPPLSLHDALPIYPLLDLREGHLQRARKLVAAAHQLGRLAHCPAVDADRHAAIIPQVLTAHNREAPDRKRPTRSEEHTSELQSHLNLVCRLLLEKK